MKMGIGLFIGILLILAGIGLIIKIVFNIDLPVFRIFIAVVLIYIGIKMLSGGFRINAIHPGDNAVIFGEMHFNGLPENKEYSVIFGSAIINLSSEDSLKKDEKIKINTIFGGTEVIIQSEQPVCIKADAAFASAQLPGQKETSFGNIEYKTDAYDKKDFKLDIEASTVFGQFEVIEK